MESLYRVIGLFLICSVVSCDNSLNLGGGKNGSPDDNSDFIVSNQTGTKNDPFSGKNPNCLGTMSIDGEGGFLWKPVSESDGNLAILFPKEFKSRFFDVLVSKEDGDQESGSFVGFTNGERQTWRFEDAGHEYTGIVQVDAGSQTCEWIVPDPSERQD